MFRSVEYRKGERCYLGFEVSGGAPGDTIAIVPNRRPVKLRREVPPERTARRLRIANICCQCSDILQAYQSRQRSACCTSEFVEQLSRRATESSSN
jgi:hypothetical protein